MRLSTAERRTVIASVGMAAIILVAVLVVSVWGRNLATLLVDSGVASQFIKSASAAAGIDEVTAWQHRLKTAMVRLVLAALGAMIVARTVMPFAGATGS